VCRAGLAGLPHSPGAPPAKHTKAAARRRRSAQRASRRQPAGCTASYDAAAEDRRRFLLSYVQQCTPDMIDTFIEHAPSQVCGRARMLLACSLAAARGYARARPACWAPRGARRRAARTRCAGRGRDALDHQRHAGHAAAAVFRRVRERQRREPRAADVQRADDGLPAVQRTVRCPPPAQARSKPGLCALLRGPPR